MVVRARIPFLRVLFALVFLAPLAAVMVAGCGAAESPVSTASRAEETFDFANGAQPGSERYVQVARPVCPDGFQPGVVGFRDSDEGTRIPVWTCASGCDPGKEFIALLGQPWGHITNRCERICSPGSHRLAYVTPNAPACTRGDPPPEEAAALAREEHAGEGAFFVLEKERLTEAMEAVSNLERAPVPWVEADDDRWTLGALRLRQIEDARAATHVQLGRPRELDALAAQVRKLEVHHREYKELRGKPGRSRTAGIETDDATCVSACGSRRDRCLGPCHVGGAEACAACERDYGACMNAFEAWKAQRTREHVYGEPYPRGCGHGG